MWTVLALLVFHYSTATLCLLVVIPVNRLDSGNKKDHAYSQSRTKLLLKKNIETNKFVD